MCIQNINLKSITILQDPKDTAHFNTQLHPQAFLSEVFSIK